MAVAMLKQTLYQHNITGEVADAIFVEFDTLVSNAAGVDVDSAAFLDKLAAIDTESPKSLIVALSGLLAGKNDTGPSTTVNVPSSSLASTMSALVKTTTDMIASATVSASNNMTSYGNVTISSNITAADTICDPIYTVDECDFIIRFETILYPIDMVLIIIGLFANVFIVYSVASHRDMHTFSNLFMTNLSATQLVYLVVIGVTDVYDFVLTSRSVKHSSVIPSSIHLYVSLVITNCDVSMLTALSVEHYVTMTIDPRKLAKIHKGKVAFGACAIIWLASIAVCAPVFYGVDTTTGKYVISTQNFQIAIMVSFIISYIIPLIIIAVIYMAIRRKMRMRGASMRVRKGSKLVARTPEEYKLYQDRKIMRSILVIIVLYSFNFGARYITKIILYTSVPLGNLAVFLTTQLSEIGAVLTAALQPIVYAVLHPHFKDRAREMCRSFLCGNTTCVTECRDECGKCYIACCTCCGLVKLAPLPRLTIKRDVELGPGDNRDIDRVIIIQNIELETIPPPEEEMDGPTTEDKVVPQREEKTKVDMDVPPKAVTWSLNDDADVKSV